MIKKVNHKIKVFYRRLAHFLERGRCEIKSVSRSTDRQTDSGPPKHMGIRPHQS